MNIVGKFEKVSFEQFAKAMEETNLSEQSIRDAYDGLILPKRATKGSAGYDFHTPLPIHLEPGKTLKIPTGIRCLMNEDWVLAIFPRSGLGFKYRLQLNNTVGIIDSDYAGSDNEGHIFIKITNDSNEGKTLKLQRGDAFAQGIFLPYGITEDDETSETRNGGFGSTSDRK